MGRELVSVVDDVFLKMVNNLDAWNSFPWGKNPNHVPSYSLTGFLYAFKKGKVATLIDRVCDLEGICETLLTLPKEVKSFKGRIIKLESIIHSSLYPGKGFGKEETLKKVGPQIKDFLQTTSEDEPDIKDDTSPKEVVYYCDDNGDPLLFFMPAKHSEIQRLYNHRETRLNKIAEEDKQRKCIGHMNSSAHIKLAIEMCMPKKRKYVDVMRSPYSGLSTTLNIPSIEQLANQKNVLNPFMIEKYKSIKPWIEALSRLFKRIDKIFLSHDLEEFFSRFVVGHCKLFWCNDISVDRSFWNGLCGLDDNRKGWLLDEIEQPSLEASHRSDEIWYDVYFGGNEKGKVLLDDLESVGFGKGKVLLDDFKAVGNGKDKVGGDDVKDELISTKGDGEQNEGSSSSSNFH
ncbi:hypothetical protein Tco_0140150 [Tanacetum coccineum]